MSTEQKTVWTASVPLFEQAIQEKRYEDASNYLLEILRSIDRRYGSLNQVICDIPEQLLYSEREQYSYVCTRLADGIARLFMDPEFCVSRSGFLRFMEMQRWMGILFAASPYMNADHVLRTYCVNGDDENWKKNAVIQDNTRVLEKFCILYFLESNVELNLDVLWNIDPQVCASLCFGLQSPRFIGTEKAFAKRGLLLQWLGDKLDQDQVDLENLPSSIIHDVYMHCSYDISLHKHRIKRSVNRLVRRCILRMGWQDRDVSVVGSHQGKPVMVVLLEHFHDSHSIYRTHSTSLIAAKKHFYIVGMGSKAVDESGRAVFDEFVEMGEARNILGEMQCVRDVCERYQAAVLYMPSIGMDVTTIFMSNTRVAPVQVIALGHPATTHSEFIDYVVVEDDYVGSEDCFSEVLLRLPKDALPYVPSAQLPENVEYCLRKQPDVVHIGVACSTMKLNPYFLKACQAIRDRAAVKVHFHFAMAQSIGISHLYISRFVRSYLGDDATTYPNQPYRDYLAVLNDCDMMVNPFPFGNTNGIIDMVVLGLVGVCKTGPEVHEHIDEGLFKRLGLPESLITQTAEQYVQQAVWLAENHKERLALRRSLIKKNGLNTLFTGNPDAMGEVLWAKLQEKQAAQLAKVEETQSESAVEVVAEAVSSESEPAEAKAKSSQSTKAPARKRTTRKKTSS